MNTDDWDSSNCVWGVIVFCPSQQRELFPPIVIINSSYIVASINRPRATDIDIAFAAPSTEELYYCILQITNSQTG